MSYETHGPCMPSTKETRPAAIESELPVENYFYLDADVLAAQRGVCGFDTSLNDTDNEWARKAIREGFSHYSSGKWADAREKYELLLASFPGDECSSAIYEFMKTRDFVAPDNWTLSYRRI